MWFRIVVGIGCIVGGIALIVYQLGQSSSTHDLKTTIGVLVGGGCFIAFGLLLLITTILRQRRVSMQGTEMESQEAAFHREKFAAAMRESVRENALGAIPGSEVVQFVQKFRASHRNRVIIGVSFVGIEIYAVVASLQNHLASGVMGGIGLIVAGLVVIIISTTIAQRLVCSPQSRQR